LHSLADLPYVTVNADIDMPVLFIDTIGCNLGENEAVEGESKSNEGEAEIVTVHLEELIKAGLKPLDIGIITPYNAQVDLLRKKLKDKYKDLEIGSVDGFQGREKEAIIISMVRSNTRGDVGFLKDDRRTNVAITRAKRHIAIIADSETISAHPFLQRYVTYLLNTEYYSGENYLDPSIPRAYHVTDVTKSNHNLPKKEKQKDNQKEKKKEKLTVNQNNTLILLLLLHRHQLVIKILIEHKK